MSDLIQEALNHLQLGSKLDVPAAVALLKEAQARIPDWTTDTPVPPFKYLDLKPHPINGWEIT